MNEHGYCPNCKADLDGGLIWDFFYKDCGVAALADERAEMYGATRTTGKWGRATGHYSMEQDRTVGQTCPDCNHYWGYDDNKI